MKWQSATFEASAGLASQLVEPDLPEVAFSGRSNVGKSSMINSILGRKGLARTSATPGKTATVNFYKLDSCRMVDLPGYGYAKVSGADKTRWKELINGYLNADRDLRLVIQLVDARHAPSKEDNMMIDFFATAGVPFLIALTKADKLNKTQRAERLADFDRLFSKWDGLKVIPFSSETGENVEQLREIVESVTGE